ncbi:hypothetical protein [Tenuibacillus multivorans]|uniref:DUF2326 domain-containing protein n=1 Tax=Tenuibacillus multivorans TaxID=237069 RepID=A0A1H0DGH9_9BACI|nr:hypothetical protein [Tenuibacillus multivorans]GEL76562.1 hypothetical protein TMU01_07970 [Tenuibacillus multivorans]SDN69260.1 hypothetical protein SAMN05216498_2863 [Tenuibacillus multivorans]
MYLNSLKIAESSPSDRVIRDVNLKNGLNIIVDESNNDRGNNVGKTTFLKLIDICLGARDKKYIWTDYDTNSETRNLKKYIHENKVYSELTIEKNNITYSLKVELFNKGRRYINGEGFSRDDYYEELNKILFNIESPPTFRQLINKFVRIKQNDNSNNATLKYLHSNTNNDQYRNIYEFLFKLDDIENSTYRLELNEDINQLTNSINKLFDLHQFNNIEDLKERIKIAEKRAQELQSSIDVLIDKEKFKHSLEEVTKIKHELNIISDSLNDAYFRKTKTERILDKESDNNLEINEDILYNFYNEVTKKIDNISKEFEELIDFNKKIKRNKIEYYQNRLSDIQKDIDEMEYRRELIINQNKDAITLINEENFSEYEKKYNSLLAENQLLGELYKVINIYNEKIEQLTKKEKELLELENNQTKTDNITTFNNFFSKYTELALGQRLYIYPNNSGFPVGISNFDDGFGSGYKKTITLLLDIAYVSFLNKLDLDYPRFIVHDELETIDEFNFDKVVETINQNGTQFIFGILNEKIEGYSFIDENDIILRLSSDNKLFRV